MLPMSLPLFRRGFTKESVVTQSLVRTRVSKTIYVTVVESKGSKRYAANDALSFRYKGILWELIHAFSENPHPSLVLLEADWGKGDCARVMEIVRRNKVATCPVILFSDTRDEKDLKAFASVVRADGFLPRAFSDPQHISEWVQNFLAGHRESA